MEHINDTLLRQMTATIVDVADPEQVILFGSRARGNAEADSDVDLVVVEAEPFGPGRDRGAEETRIWRALAKFHVPKDILVFSLEGSRPLAAGPSIMYSRARCAKARCSMSDLEQAQELFDAAERDISALRGMDDAAVFRGRDFRLPCSAGGGEVVQGLARFAGRNLPAVARSGSSVGHAEHRRSGCRRFRRVGGLHPLRRAPALRRRRSGRVPA